MQWDPTWTMIIIVLVVILLILAIIIPNVKILKEYDRAVIFRLGKALEGTKGPGLIWLWPFIDKMNKIDLREMFFDLPHQRCITVDNAPVDVDVLIYYRVINARDTIIKVRDFRASAIGVTQTTLRSVIGDIDLDSVLARREYINSILREKLDEITDRWGVKVTTVEIREILPPGDVQKAMVEQMKAERNRRAMVTEASGKRESHIAVATGDKQAQILKAEGAKRSNVLEAEGEREAALLRAEGYANALEKIFAVAKNIDEKTLTLQILDTLKAIGASPSTKYIFPMSFMELIKPIDTYLKGGLKSKKT
ncbi:MAG: SPFH/Band 7/PHB domain protein [Candidatus Helarchaeota archaeon]|nr:SPFH/Band 7/PHB domain protein [Candidatus Helarchaeota archaeon]